MKKRSAKFIATVTVASVIGAAVLGAIAYALYMFIAFLCGGYNSLMREYLGDPDNYVSIDAELACAYYYAESSRDIAIIDENTSSDAIVGTVYFECKSVSAEIAEYTGDRTVFELTADNARLLISSGFFSGWNGSDLKPIKLRATVWIYMDNDFNFIAEVGDGNEIYLDLEQGLENIVELMNAHKI